MQSKQETPDYTTPKFRKINGRQNVVCPLLTLICFEALLLWQKTAGCLSSHAITNLELEIYVVATKNWMF